MRTKNYKLLNGTAIMAAILCSVQIVWLVIQSWFISGLGGVDGEINVEIDDNPAPKAEPKKVAPAKEVFVLASSSVPSRCTVCATIGDLIFLSAVR